MTAYTFDQIIDFTRTSAATYVANTGFVTQTPASRNLLTYTQEFDNAAWTKTNANAYPFDPASATLGPEVISNGDFATTASWALAATAPATATIAGGKLTLVSPAGEAASAFQAVLTVGKWYKVTGDVTVRSGTVKVICGGPTEYYFTATQSFTIYAQANGNTSLSLSRQGACDADFDNISVREVIGGLITAPDGTLTGDALIATATTAVHWMGRTATVTAATAYTFSVYVKAGTSNFIQLLNTGDAQAFANFNVATGAVGTTGSKTTASIVSVGNGWYRCIVTFNTTASLSNDHRFYMVSSSAATYAQSWTATGTESILIWGAQLEAASAASTYTRNNGGVYPPRFDYDPVTLAPRGLLIEEQRTNLVLRSEEFDNAVWARNGNGAAAVPVVTANAGISPDGTMNADRVQFDCTDNTNTNNRSSLVQSVTVVNAAPYRGSLYVKAFDAGNVGKTIRITSDGLGTVVATLTANWTRVEFGGTSTFTVTNYIIECRGTYTTQTADVLIWGAQLEAGSFATSYIPTVASQVTRTADLATVTGANFSRWYNQSEGTFVVEMWLNALSTVANQTAVIAQTDTSNLIAVRANQAGGQRSATVVTAGVNQGFLDIAGTAANVVQKLGYAYRTNDTALVVNGGTPATDNTVTLPTVNTLYIGATTTGNYTNGHIRRIRYYPTRLSNTQLQALTA